MTTPTAMLQKALRWFEQSNDGQEGCNYMNGDSGKYLGDGQADAEALEIELREFLARQAAAPQGREALERETIQILLDLLNPLHGSLDVQVTAQFADERELDPPKDREYNVDVTWQMERDLAQAVMILENRKRTPAVAPDGALRDALRPFAALLDTDSNGYESSPDDEVVRSVGTLGRDYAVITVGDLRRARAALAQAQEPREDKPIAWRYELAHAGWDKDTYRLWNFHLSETEPRVPEGSIRNLTPLYAAPPPQVDSEREAREKEITRMATIEECATIADYQAKIPSNTEVQRAHIYSATAIAKAIRALALRPERSGGRGA